MNILITISSLFQQNFATKLPDQSSDSNTFLRPQSVNPVSVTKPRASKQFGRVSKFKHLKGDVILKEGFNNLKKLSRTVSAECNYIHGKCSLHHLVKCIMSNNFLSTNSKCFLCSLANENRVAVPMDGPGGKLAIFEAAKPGRIPDGVLPVLINGTTVMDFAFDPFDNGRVVTVCDDG